MACINKLQFLCIRFLFGGQRIKFSLQEFRLTGMTTVLDEGVVLETQKHEGVLGQAYGER